jgi:hypothetical protein
MDYESFFKQRLDALRAEGLVKLGALQMARCLSRRASVSKLRC